MATLTLMLGIAAAAAAHPRVDGGGEFVDSAAGQADELLAVLGESARPTDDGLYQVTLDDGTELSTHGPDSGRLASARAGAIREGARRRPTCAREYTTRFAIAAPADARPGAAPARAIRSSVERANALIAASAYFSGWREADLRVACDRRGRVRVGYLPTRAHDFAAVVSAARRKGLRSPSANYAIFARGRLGDACGTSSFRPDDRPGPENRNREGGAYAVIYGNCRGSAEIVLHEIAHMLGAVQYAAPFSTGFGRHCWDELDVVCYVPDGGNLHQTGVFSRCPMISFDCGYDTYFDAAPEAGEYLATHWNLGSPLNRFLLFR